ncbi:PRD domain-containing protein [Paenibacillus gorillae]|uniref:PRD domain-containing protein n=1 Tax=Paenibacillus gorillae TaxID=1243662 RepID=UPI0004B147F2|nr:PRD domain-containing protein [Paenibacillus gorillae]
MAGAFRIERVIGNNVLLTIDSQTEREYVLVGKGLGFTAKSGMLIDGKDPKIEKKFRLDDTEQVQHFQSLLEDIDPAIIRITEQTVQQIKQRTGSAVSPKVYFALPSHIQFAVFRLRNGMDIVNPLLNETKRSFPIEFEIASQLAEWINEQFQVDIPEDEIGFLTFHIYSAIYNVPVGQLVKQAEQNS